MKTLIACLLLALAASAIAQNAPSPADATPAITAVQEGLVSAFSHGDLDEITSYLDPAVVVTWPNAEVSHGPEAVRAFYQRTLGGEKRVVRAIKVEPEVLGRQIESDRAIVWGNLHDHLVLNDGSDLVLDSVFTATFAKRGDRWLVVAFHASVNAFQNPILAAAFKKTAMPIGLGSFIGGLVIGLLAVRVFRKQAVEA